LLLFFGFGLEVDFAGFPFLELPDSLFAEAKAVAVRRSITLKDMFEHALRRDIAFEDKPSPGTLTEINDHGFPVMKKCGNRMVANEEDYRLLDEEGL
jgi:hypothetical protein